MPPVPSAPRQFPPGNPGLIGKRKSDRWREIWVRKGVAPPDEVSLMDILALESHDTGGGTMTEPAWMELHAEADRRLEVRPGEQFLEVGCGAGAFLFPFARKGARISGTDHSATLLDIARRVLPRGSFKEAEANNLPFASGTFDKVATMGILLHFPGWAYTEMALSEMLRVLKPGGRCLVLDINDAEKMAIAEDIRERNLGPDRYRELYEDLRQMYYDRNCFLDFATSRGLTHDVFDQRPSSYDSAQWRFNFYFEKP